MQLYQVYKWEMRIFFYETRYILKSNKRYFIQNMFQRLLHIFPIFRVICEYHVSKNLPLLLQTIDWAIFSHPRTNQSAALQECDPSMQTSGNRKEPSPVN